MVRKVVIYLRRIDELVDAPETLLSTMGERSAPIWMRDPFEGRGVDLIVLKSGRQWMRRFVCVMACAAALAGCASGGVQALKDETTQTVAAKITKGRSTQADVKAAFGDPISTSFTDSGNELWNYQYIKLVPKAVDFVPVVGLFAGGSDVEKKTLVVFFDKNGIVQNFALSSAKTEILQNR